MGLVRNLSNLAKKVPLARGGLGPQGTLPPYVIKKLADDKSYPMETRLALYRQYLEAIERKETFRQQRLLKRRDAREWQFTQADHAGANTKPGAMTRKATDGRC